jgi:hypothetical protein
MGIGCRLRRSNSQPVVIYPARQAVVETKVKSKIMNALEQNGHASPAPPYPLSGRDESSSINARNAGYDGRKLGEANSRFVILEIILRDRSVAILRAAVISTTNAFLAGGNLQDKREERQHCRSAPISSIIWRNRSLRFRSLDSGSCQIRVLRERRSSLTQSARTEEVYAFWQQHVSTDVVQSRSGMRHTASCSIAAPPSLLLPPKWRRQT